MSEINSSRSPSELVHQDAILVIVAFHPSQAEIQRIQACLAALPPGIGYAIVANDHRPGEPIDALSEGAVLFLVNAHNPGYGRAVNQAVHALAHRGKLPAFLGALNTDLAWEVGTFEGLLARMVNHPEVALVVPQLVDLEGVPQQLCKRNPTLLGLFSRRFVPDRVKPAWLHRYDRWYVMADHDYTDSFEAPYLSGCCMLMRTSAFQAVGGFDERFFLYLEDADITRSLRSHGLTLHVPSEVVVHHWGRGNHRSRRLTLVNLHSAWLYFSKWGWRLW
jgi:GT2 family glycosyltransferase